MVSLLAAAAAAFDRQELAFLYIKAGVRLHLPLVEAGTAQRLAVGACLAGGGEFNDGGHG